MKINTKNSNIYKNKKRNANKYKNKIRNANKYKKIPQKTVNKQKTI